MNLLFEDVVSQFIEERGQTAGRLALISGVSKQTIASWREGRVKRPRNVDSVLMVASALRLTPTETNQLLEAANLGTLQSQIEVAEKEQDQVLLDILAFWQIVDPASPILKSEPPFQAVSKIEDFVGRETEIEEVSNILMQGGTICVLQGMGGVGKSTLANHLAYRLRDSFADGVLYAALDDVPLSEEQMLAVLGNFAAAYGLDVREDTDVNSRSRTVRDLLSSKQVLVILDGAHGTNEVMRILPASTESCSVVITTRNKKMLRDRAHLFDINSFSREDGLNLLRQICGFQKVDAEQAEAEEIIEFVGGLALAIRIVGSALAEAEGLTLAEYRDLLLDERSQLEVLADWEDASKNVRSSIELSFNRLPPELKQLLGRLSIFVGRDFSAEAVSALCQKPLALIKMQLGRLNSLSLIDLIENPLVRYRFHPLLRTFSREKLDDDVALLKLRLVDYYADLSQGTEEYAELDAEWENLKAAIMWAQENEWEKSFVSTLESLTYLDLGLAGYLDARGYWQEAQRWLSTVSGSETVIEDAVRHSLSLMKEGLFSYRLGSYEPAEQKLSRSLELIEDVPLKESTAITRAYSCELLAQLSMKDGLEEALDWMDQGMAGLREVDSAETSQLLGYMQIRQSGILGRIGDLGTAQKATQEGLDRLPDKPSAARISGLTNLGTIAYLSGDLDRAETHWQAAIADAEIVGDSRRTADLWQNLGTFFSSKGDFTQSVQLYENATELYRRIGHALGECRGLANSADDLRKIGRETEAVDRLETAITKSSQLQLDAEIFALFNRARLQTYIERPETAHADLDRAEDLSKKRRLTRWMGMIATVRAEVALLNQNLAEAQTIIDQAFALGLDDEEKGIALRLRGQILAQLGQIQEASAAYTQSTRILKETMRFEYMRTRVAQAELQLSQNQDAKPILEDALRAFTEMAAPREIRKVKTLLQAV